MLRQKIRPRVKGISFNRIIPNLLTILGLCAGLISIRSAIHGRFNEAVIAILIAACFDGLDGRIARLLRGTSRFGAELDSLVDFLSFGVAPSLVLYLWSLKNGGDYSFIPVQYLRYAWLYVWHGLMPHLMITNLNMPAIFLRVSLPRQVLE